MATLNINTELNGIEIKFDSKPELAILTNLKESGFRWHNQKKIWYAKNTPERMELANSIADGKTESAPAVKTSKKKENKFGVKVGDLFYASWGYEQTNVDFFQVIELVGATSVRVREVYPPMIKEDAVSGMSADRTYSLTKELLPPANHSVFIDDQEKGDLKRLKSYAADGISNPQFNLSSFASAYYCEGETTTLYESWYA